MAWWVTWYEFLGWCITTSHWRDRKTFKSKNLRAHLTKLHISTQSLRKPDLEMGESLFSHLNYCHKVSQWNIHRNISWYLHRNSKTRITCPLWCVVPSSHIWAGVWDLYDFCNGIYLPLKHGSVPFFFAHLYKSRSFWKLFLDSASNKRIKMLKMRIFFCFMFDLDELTLYYRCFWVSETFFNGWKPG